MSKYIQGYKVRSDATLLSWKKRELVDLIRILEKSYQNEVESAARVYKYITEKYPAEKMGEDSSKKSEKS